MLNKKWFKKETTISKVEDMFPLVYLLDDNKTVRAKNGEFTQVVEILGKDYTGLSPEHISNLSTLRGQFIEDLPSTIQVKQYSHRYEANTSEITGFFKSSVISDISNKWNDRFISSFRTRHFLVFTTSKAAVADQLANIIDNSKNESNANWKLRNLNDSVNKSTLKLAEYNPRILVGDEHLTYWSWNLNGKHLTQSVPPSRCFNDVIAGVALEWPEGENYQIYEDDSKKYSAWISIKFFEDDPTSQDLIDQLFAIKRNFTLYQSFSVLDKSEALKAIQSRIDNAVSFTDGLDIIMLELEEAKSRDPAGQFFFCFYRFSFNVFSD
jgi:hypothetical protein